MVLNNGYWFPKYLTFGFLLNISQLSQHSGLIVPEEFLAPRCLLFKLWAFKISLQIPVCHWVTSRNPSSCFIILTPKALTLWLLQSQEAICLFIYNCSASADLGRVPKHWWELTCSYTKTTHVSSPISADSQKYWVCTLDVTPGFHTIPGLLTGYLTVLCPVV